MKSTWLAPESIAIVGVSADAGKHGRRVFDNLRKVGFAGEIWGVNPKLPEIDGLALYAGITDLPGVPDLVVSAVPRQAVPEVVADSAEIGAGVVVVLAGGFAESGAAGEGLQAALLTAVTGSSTRVLGPNSGGVIVPSAGLAASFLTCLDRPAAEIRSGVVGLVTQSGGTGSYVHNLAADAGSGLAASISTGNEADLDVADGISALVDLDEVRAIALVLETVRSGAKFLAAVAAAHAAAKPVVLCHLGRTGHSAGMLATHTGALATDQTALAGVCNSLGIATAATPGELLEVAEIMARAAPAAGHRLGVVTHSGGVAILLADMAAEKAIALPQPDEEATKELAPLLDLGAASNPLDMGAIIGGPHRFAEVVDIFSRHHDVVLAVSSAHPPAHSVQRAEALAALSRVPPIVHLWMAGDVSAAGASLLRAAHLPMTAEPRAAIAAVNGLIRFGQYQREGFKASGVTSGSDAKTLSEHDSKAWLSSAGVAVVSGSLATTPSEAAAAADQLGGTVVVKVSSPDIVHKARAGGVRTGVVGGGAARHAFEEIVAAVAAHNPSAQIDGVRVEREVAGLEVIAAAFVHPQFGAMVSFGLGGSDVEARGDVAMALAPVDLVQAERLIDSSRAVGLLSSTRFAAVADRGQLAQLVVSLGDLVAAGRATEIEINPLAWTGAQWLALDAVVRISDSPPTV